MQKPLWPALLTLVMLATLIGLGVWQMQRAQWKETIIAQRKAQLAAPIQYMTQDNVFDAQALAFQRAHLSLKNVTLQPFYLFESQAQKGVGYRAFFLVAIKEGLAFLMDSPSFYAANENRPRETRMVEAIEDAGLFIAVDDAFQKRVAEQNPKLPRAYKPILFRAAPDAATMAALTTHYLDIPNNHRAYAAFWFSLAFVLVVIYGVAHRKRHG